jgi:hypothetical protein
MNTPKSNIDWHSSHISYPQVESLFKSLSISAQERQNIEKDFYSIAKIVYENPQQIIDKDIIVQIKLWETNRRHFETKYASDRAIVEQYINFIKKYPDWAKIWRMLSAYYDPRKTWFLIS